MPLATLSIDITARTAALDAAIDGTTRRAQKRASEIQQAWDQAGKGISAGMQAAMAGAAAALGASLSIAGLAALVGDVTQAQTELAHLSQMTGVSVERLSAFGDIAKRSGMDVSDLAEQFNELSLRLTEQEDDTEGMGLALKQIGINFKDLKSMSPDEQMLTIAKALDGFADSGDKAAAIMAIYGDEGQKLLPILNDLAQAQELVGSVTAEQAALAEHYRDKLAALESAGGAWSKSVVSGMLPALDETVTALLDVTTGTGGLLSEVKQLAADGSITDWTRTGVTAITYLIDGLAYLKRSFQVVGETIGADAAMIGASFSGMATAAERALSGDFAGAADAVKSTMAQVGHIAKDADKTIGDIWGADTLGSRIRDRIGEIQAAGKASADAARTTAQAVAAPRKKLGLNMVKADEEKKKSQGDDAQKKQLEEYEKLITKIREKTAADQLAVDSETKATEAQRMALEVMTQIRDGRLKLSDAQKRTVVGYLEEALAVEKLAAAKEAEKKWLEESGAETQRAVEAAMAKAEALKDAARAEQMATEEAGLGADELERLRTQRQLDTAAALESRAAAMEGLSSHEALAEIWREQAAAIREVVAQQKKRVEIEKAARADVGKGAREGLKKYLDEISDASADTANLVSGSLRGVEDNLTAMVTSQKSSWKDLFTSILEEATRLYAIRPLMKNLFGDGSLGGEKGGWIGSALGAAKSLVGGEGGGSGSGSGEGVGQVVSWIAGLFGGGRATGGPVSAGRLYEVNETGTPELLDIGGKQMLMMGRQAGTVIPLTPVESAASSRTAASSLPAEATGSAAAAAAGIAPDVVAIISGIARRAAETSRQALGDGPMMRDAATAPRLDALPGDYGGAPPTLRGWPRQRVDDLFDDPAAARGAAQDAVPMDALRSAAGVTIHQTFNFSVGQHVTRDELMQVAEQTRRGTLAAVADQRMRGVRAMGDR